MYFIFRDNPPQSVELCSSVKFDGLKCCLDICDVKGDRGEKGPGGKSGSPVSHELSLFTVTLNNNCYSVVHLSNSLLFSVFQGEMGMPGPRGYKGPTV